MLTNPELKIVIATLTKRRAWLKKNLEDSSVDPAARKESANALTLIESAMKKLSSSVKPAASPTPSPPKTTVSKAPAAPQVKPNKPKTVESALFLVAEDNEDSAELLMNVLQDIGAKNAVLAKDGKDAFDKIKACQEGFDIILCDWDMPELSGLEVHQKAKASNTLKGAHFVMVTAVSEAARIRAAIQQGVNDYIVKPIDIDVLEGKIKVALGVEN